MPRSFIILLSVLFFTFVVLPFAPAKAVAAQEDTLVGTLVRHGNVFVLETDEGDYIVKGKDLAKMEGKLVEITGTISEGAKGDMIDANSVEEIEE